MVNQWGPLKGKWKYDSTGKRWEERYKKHCVGTLEAGADDLEQVANFMNETFSKVVSGDSARLNERKPFVTPSVVHTLSEYESIKGVRSHYCYLIMPNSPFIWFRRYTCTTCVKCKALDFLNCINERCGKWKKAYLKLKKK